MKVLITSNFESETMKIILKNICLVLMGLIWVVDSAMAQESDSEDPQLEVSVMDFDTFMKFVSEHHPLSKSAELRLKESELLEQKAKGGFDPKLYAESSEKRFDDKRYYQHSSAGVKIPTWLGLELQAGVDQSVGEYINPESKTPDGGLYYAGLSMNLLRGLTLDKRRLERKKAQQYETYNEEERKIRLNKLYQEAGNSYWNWFVAYNILDTYHKSLELSTERFEQIKRNSELGDKPALDTLIAKIQVQEQEMALKDAEIKYYKATQELGTYMWFNGSIPLALSDNVTPEALEKVLLEAPKLIEDVNVDSLLENHPIIKQNQTKIDMLMLEQRWSKEQLKPNLNLKYNVLSENVLSQDGSRAFSPLDNYKWGVSFEMPLFLRKERAGVKISELKIEEQNYANQSKQQELVAKVKVQLQTIQNNLDQLDLYSQTMNNYGSLLTAEQRLYSVGEGSLFLVNSRESNYIKAQVDWIKLFGKTRINVIDYEFISGTSDFIELKNEMESF
ncbi:transporter (plasmid) [Aureibacter tunicatorum]|nr:transporter [Aureibacter tunicatorum]